MPSISEEDKELLSQLNRQPNLKKRIQSREEYGLCRTHSSDDAYIQQSPDPKKHRLFKRDLYT